MTDRFKKIMTMGRGVSKKAKKNADVPFGRPPSSLKYFYCTSSLGATVQRKARRAANLTNDGCGIMKYIFGLLFLPKLKMDFRYL